MKSIYLIGDRYISEVFDFIAQKLVGYGFLVVKPIQCFDNPAFGFSPMRETVVRLQREVINCSDIIMVVVFAESTDLDTDYQVNYAIDAHPVTLYLGDEYPEIYYQAKAIIKGRID